MLTSWKTEAETNKPSLWTSKPEKQEGAKLYMLGSFFSSHWSDKSIPPAGEGTESGSSHIYHSWGIKLKFPPLHGNKLPEISISYEVNNTYTKKHFFSIWSPIQKFNEFFSVYLRLSRNSWRLDPKSFSLWKLTKVNTNISKFQWKRTHGWGTSTKWQTMWSSQKKESWKVRMTELNYEK